LAEILEFSIQKYQ